MDSSLIGKIEKAKRYAQEKERFQFNKFTITMKGTNNPHVIKFEEGFWDCDCDFFRSRGRCSHTMALEMILEEMITENETIVG
ncbi:MAG: hypothetical protein MUO76_21045 [Anaerolineaceae bacterium]|jgi:hypothetical protein|nr:hypothetical protein [Anaerolineaceae bacterium]